MSLPDLLAAGLPDLERPNAQLADAMRQLVARHGALAVRKAAVVATKVRAGRKAIPDNRQLASFLVDDLEDWLAGRDPFAQRTNYSIAQAYADRFPGHSRYATCKRIERKLKRFRPFVLYARAERVTHDGYPLQYYIRAVQGLSRLGDTPDDLWSRTLDSVSSKLELYAARFRREPDREMSMADVETELAPTQNALLAFLKPLSFGRVIPAQISDASDGGTK